MWQLKNNKNEHMKSPRAAAHPSTNDHWGFHMANKTSPGTN
jgi:hypothetical protein